MRQKLLSVVVALAGFGWTGAIQAADFKVVVHGSNPVTSISKSDLSKLFLKKERKWETGVTVVPVDLLAGSATRTAFNRDVHGKEQAAIGAYWQAQIFAGRATPPPEVASSSEVLEFVRANSGGVGYVGDGVAIGEGVKVVSVTD